MTYHNNNSTSIINDGQDESRAYIRMKRTHKLAVCTSNPRETRAYARAHIRSVSPTNRCVIIIRYTATGASGSRCCVRSPRERTRSQLWPYPGKYFVKYCGRAPFPSHSSDYEIGLLAAETACSLPLGTRPNTHPATCPRVRRVCSCCKPFYLSFSVSLLLFPPPSLSLTLTVSPLCPGTHAYVVILARETRNSYKSVASLSV